MNRSEKRILVVDDSDSVRRFLRDLLLDLGFPLVDEANDGDVALELFRHHPYGMVITDWSMPRTSGIELLRAIRQGPLRSQTPVLLLTGHVTAGREVEAMEAGANGFVAKPFVGPALSEKVLLLVR